MPPQAFMVTDMTSHQHTVSHLITMFCDGRSVITLVKNRKFIAEVFVEAWAKTMIIDTGAGNGRPSESDT